MPHERKPFPRTLPMLGGLAAVAVAMAWSRSHPARSMLELAESPTFLRGTAEAGLADRHAWVIRNVGTTPLKLRTRFTSGRSGFSLWQGQDHLIGPGERVTTHLTWFSPIRPSVPFSAHVVLRSNDPEIPELRLRVVGISGSMNSPGFGASNVVRSPYLSTNEMTPRHPDGSFGRSEK